MKSLSIIVPIHNKKYLTQCIESILNQKYGDIEIILVDDGSRDGAGGICDQYQRADTRIQVIHQKNAGCMQARYNGLLHSQGEYIGFVDSDDWIDPYMYQELIFTAAEKKCDIVSTGYTAVFGQEEIQTDDATLSGYYERGKNLDQFLSRMMHDEEKAERGVNPSLCTKIIKRELLTEAFAEADRNITMGEDAAIFYPCCLEMKSIYIMREYRYFYRIHSDSMCRNITTDTICKTYSFYQYMQKKFSKYGKQYDLPKQLKKYLWTLLEHELNQLFQIRVKRVYIFPYTAIEKGSDIILYGAGEVGRSYYGQIMDNHYCNIIAWADKNAHEGLPVIHLDQLPCLNSTKILIAVKKNEMADEIRNELISLGADEEKILWFSPQEVPVV